MAPSPGPRTAKQAALITNRNMAESPFLHRLPTEIAS
ncbi:hypothetical protein A1F94_001596 [Pyrenophora tritici-repentis]|uniref:Uncharacterized protein n=1 Tax=Pyrenophora tritici-repentis TaxID=45151 RepID=A0A5M9LLX3_9PLEO|nr:hypothetical protein PtrV1_02197 [Pyrenophora tritici-repentis]KAF7454943.1 hypothetical protein A1F99_022010 [Pyrenophora tritici-repentis]KAF7578090.1 hypothetical protein PtrM4_023300 [Pyrenophora tritici-repentis]KAG9388703.1 hypothetical protein A1F94_001596 [Pyrenophora tritici-repentis]KAI0571759.1 hypothetical protein Alg130_10764 [Pyrenophora tritici-repentis]